MQGGDSFFPQISEYIFWNLSFWSFAALAAALAFEAAEAGPLDAFPFGSALPLACFDAGRRGLAERLGLAAAGLPRRAMAEPNGGEEGMKVDFERREGWLGMALSVRGRRRGTVRGGETGGKGRG